MTRAPPPGRSLHTDAELGRRAVIARWHHQGGDERLLPAGDAGDHPVGETDPRPGDAVAISESTTTVTHGIVVSPDSRYAFVSVEGVGAEPGQVDIHDPRTFERVGDVEVGQQAGGITFWRMEG